MSLVRAKPEHGELALLGVEFSKSTWKQEKAPMLLRELHLTSRKVILHVVTLLLPFPSSKTRTLGERRNRNSQAWLARFTHAAAEPFARDLSSNNPGLNFHPFTIPGPNTNGGRVKRRTESGARDLFTERLRIASRQQHRKSLHNLDYPRRQRRLCRN